MNDDIKPPADAPAVAKAVAKIAGERSKTIPLEWPVEYDGKVYSEITVRRMTGREVQEFFKSKDDAGGLPMFDCPREVIEALDADDDVTINKAVLDFLPRSLRGSDE